MANIPTLGKEDVDSFFQLWLSLMEFTNQRRRIVDPKIHFRYHHQTDLLSAQKVSKYIWENMDCIDEYIEKKKPAKEKEDLLLSWKRRIKGTFFVERHLSNGTVFVFENEEVYLVKGLASSFKEMFPVTPIALEGVLLPYKDAVITDGLYSVTPVQLGKGFQDSLKNIYMRAKNSGKIHTSI